MTASTRNTRLQPDEDPRKVMADFWADFRKLLGEYRSQHPKAATYRQVVNGTNVAPQTLGQWRGKTSGLPDNVPGFFAIVEKLGGPEREWKDRFARLVDAKERVDTEKRKNGQSASNVTGASDGEPDGGGVDDHKTGDDEPGSVDGTVENGCHSGSAESNPRSTSQVVNNINHVSVNISEPTNPPSHGSSSRQNIWQRVAHRLTWWWVIVGGTLVAIALVGTLLLRSSSTPEGASGAVASSANTVTQVIPSSPPLSSSPPSTSAPTSSATSTSPPAPAPSSAPTENAPQQTTTAPPAIVDVPLQPTRAATEPAPAVPDGHCKKVDADDIRVFKDPDSNEQSWTAWPKGTFFWIEPGEGTSDRYRTVLRNGSNGWVTKNSQYVIEAEASDCP